MLFLFQIKMASGIKQEVFNLDEIKIQDKIHKVTLHPEEHQQDIEESKRKPEMLAKKKLIILMNV